MPSASKLPPIVPPDVDEVRARAKAAQENAVKATNYAARVRAMSLEVCEDAAKLLRRLKDEQAGAPPPDADRDGDAAK